MKFSAVCIAAAMALTALTAAAKPIPLDLINLPDGFKVEIYAEDMPGARSMARTPDGTLFVSTRERDYFYAVKPGEEPVRIGEDLNSPNGLEYVDGALYVAEISRITKWVGLEDRLTDPPEPEVIIDTLPTEGHHGWKYLALGPDNKLYFNIGAPCNICNEEENDPRFATISRVALDGSDFEIYAKGVRNSVGITWHPETQHMWFTDNGRDMMGDNRPPCELNRATEQGQHFGYPYCHGSDIPDPEFAAGRDCSEFTLPEVEMAAHVAPLGLKFYTGDMFPEEYRGAIFIAEHGSWNRSIPDGYRVTVVKPGASEWEVFADGWLRRTRAWGRPVDILFLPDGSMLISDDKAGCVYRVTYEG